MSYRSSVAATQERLGEALERAGLLTEAEVAYADAVVAQQNLRNASSWDTSRAPRMGLGRVYAAGGKFDKAVAEFDRATAFDEAAWLAMKAQWAEYADLYSQAVLRGAALGCSDAEAGELEHRLQTRYECCMAPGQWAHLPVTSHLVEYAWFLLACPDARFRDAKKAAYLAKLATDMAGGYYPTRKETGATFQIALALAHYRNGDVEAAFSQFQAATRAKSDGAERPDGEKRLDALERSVRAKPDADCIDYFCLALAQRRSEHREVARMWFDRGVAWMEEHKATDAGLMRFRAEAALALGVKDLPGGDRAEALVRRAVELMGKDNDAALACMREAIRIKPDWANAHSLLGAMLITEVSPGKPRDWEGGIACLREAARLEPNEPQHQINLGFILYRKGKLEEAADPFLAAAARGETRNDIPFSLYQIGRTLVGAGKSDKAAACFQAAVRLKPEWAEAYYRLGDVQFQSGDRKQASASFEEACRLDANYAEAHAALAWLLATATDPRDRDPERAVKLARQAVAVAPEHERFWAALGAALCRAEEWKEAANALDKSLELSKGGVGPDHFLLALARWKLGQKEESRRCFDRGREWMAVHKPHPEDLLRLRAEAAALLEIREDSPVTKDPPGKCP